MIYKRVGTNKQRSKLSEKRASVIFGGRVQPASGAINRFDLKGDVKSAEFLVDDKTTNKKSYTLQVKTWQKLSNEAWRMSRRPAMRIEFCEAEPVYCIDEITFREMLEAWREKRKKL